MSDKSRSLAVIAAVACDLFLPGAWLLSIQCCRCNRY